MRVGRGVRKGNESIIANGRALIITEEDKSQLKWDAIPDGTLHVNPDNGLISVKRKGDTDWTPAGIKNDGTISIAKDTIVREEAFVVREIKRSKDNAITELVYENAEKHLRHTAYDPDYGFVFHLEKGTYALGRNCVEVFIDDILRRTVSSGGVKELDEETIALPEELEVEQEITVKYYSTVKVGNPAPHFYESATEPLNAEIGDIWINYNEDPETVVAGSGILEKRATIDWSQITNKPTTLNGYGIKDDVSFVGHKHTLKDIIGTINGGGGGTGGNAMTVNYYEANANKPNTLCILNERGKVPSTALETHRHTWTDIDNRPTTLPANGGNSSTVKGYAPNGNAPGTLAILDSAGAIPANHLGPHQHSWTDIPDRPTSMPADGGNASTVNGKTVNGNAPDTLALLDSNGTLPSANIGIHQHTSKDITDMATVLGSIFLPGMIMMWYGDENSVPEGWTLCNGTNGTPDLRDRVPVGASTTKVKGVYGGEATHTLQKEELPSLGKGHFSSTSVGQGTYPSGDGVLIKTESRMAVGLSAATAADDNGRNFTLDLDTGLNSKPLNMYPPYCAVHYIMKL